MQNAPKQTKLLGATVKGLGGVAISSTLNYGYAVLEGDDQVNRRVALRDLHRDEVVFPAAAQPYETSLQLVACVVWDEVHALVPGAVALAVAA